MKTKTILSTLLVLFCLYAGVYAFNHYNAWLGFAIIILTSVITLKQIFKPNQKNQSTNNETNN